MKRRIEGFTLVELIIFMVVISVAVTAIFSAFSTALQNSPTSNYQATVISLAEARLEIILGQDRLKGFSSFSDPCPLAAACAIPAALSAYSVSSSISATSVGGDANYKIISVTATGPQNSKANVQTLVADY